MELSSHSRDESWIPLVDAHPSATKSSSSSPSSSSWRHLHRRTSRQFWTFLQKMRQPRKDSFGLPRTLELGTEGSEMQRPGIPNVIRNQKYSLFTFLPIVLYEQLIPALRVGYILTYFGPLLFVLSITIGKEAYDDYKRYERDRAANSQIYEKLIPGSQGHQESRKIPSSDIQVGDYLKIYKNSRIPADCILLRLSDPEHSCFVRTDQLDGETDWKLRIPVPSSQKIVSDEALLHAEGFLYAEKPHKDIYSFTGNVTWAPLNSTTSNSTLVEALDIENTLWMNTVLASQDYVIAIVIYTGRETRAVMNTAHPGTKVGLIDWEINRLTMILAACTFSLSLALVALNGFRGSWEIHLFRFLILFSSIIPISLRVNLDMSKTFYSALINRDPAIPGTVVRTSTIPEELGRIDYLLTDKTGTLTKNDMELKKVHLGNMLFGQESFEDIRGMVSHHFLGGSPRSPKFPMKRIKSGFSVRVAECVLALALCHNVTPSLDDLGNIEYQAASPDEVAIVKWTQAVGLTLVWRSQTEIHVRVGETATILKFYVLSIFPFTSERKRMGILLRDGQTQEIIFLIKGADSVMTTLVQRNDWLEEETGNMAREGLRTLVVGRRKLSLSELKIFQERFAAAKVSVIDRSSAIQSVLSDLLEKDLELLGLTGVEDKLQDDVKPTLESLRNAGIKIWMLTGDKVETATCVAVSSKLIARNQDVYTMSRILDPSAVLDALDNLTRFEPCLIIDGQSLQTCLDHCPKEFAAIATRLPVVVCCRCSPTQKAEVTLLIKNNTTKRVAAIGDGGNDVSMIQTAHIGVGIVGKEGQQASLAADVSVMEFRSLIRLLLWHGRNSYKRSAKLSQFVIHRGLIISVMQAVFSSLFYFAPIALYQGPIVVGYATIYTMAPVFSLVYDREVSEENAILYPELYKDLKKGRALTFKTFFIWLFVSIYQGGAIMVLAIWLFDNQLAHIVSISFTALILNELILVAMEINTWHVYMIYAQLFSISVYGASMLILKHTFDFHFVWTFQFFWKVGIITAISAVPLYIFKLGHHIWKPESYTKLEG